MCSYISILQITKQQKIKIRDELTIETKKDKFKRSVPIKCFKYLPNQQIRVPFNFYLKLTNKLPNDEIDHKITDAKFTGSLYEYQKDVTARGLEVLQEHGSVILQLRTAFGKTIICLYLGCYVGYQMIFLYTRKILKTQIIESIKEFTTLKYHIVGIKKNNTTIEDADIIICSNKLVDKIPSELRTRIGLLIVDECHTFCTEQNFNILMKFTPRFCMFLTATFERDNGLEKMIELISGEDTRIIYRNNVPFNVYRINTGLHLMRDFKITSKDDVIKIWKHLLDKQTKSVHRNVLVVKLVKYLSDRKICILTARKKMAMLIKELLIEEGEDVATMISNQDSYSDSRILIGTISKIGTGFDEKSACPDFNGKRIDCLIHMTSNKSEPVFAQTVGRGLRSNNLKVFTIVDNDNTSIKHDEMFCNWAEDNCGTVYDFDLGLLYGINVNGISDYELYDEFEIEDDEDSESVEDNDNDD